jgi:hypothetical protein
MLNPTTNQLSLRPRQRRGAGEHCVRRSNLFYKQQNWPIGIEIASRALPQGQSGGAHGETLAMTTADLKMLAALGTRAFPEDGERSVFMVCGEHSFMVSE